MPAFQNEPFHTAVLADIVDLPAVAVQVLLRDHLSVIAAPPIKCNRSWPTPCPSLGRATRSRRICLGQSHSNLEQELEETRECEAVGAAGGPASALSTISTISVAAAAVAAMQERLNIVPVS